VDFRLKDKNKTKSIHETHFYETFFKTTRICFNKKNKSLGKNNNNMNLLKSSNLVQI